MPLCVRCPTGHKLIVPDDRAGRLLRCPRCDETFVARGEIEGVRTGRAQGEGRRTEVRQPAAAVDAASVDAALATLSAVEEQQAGSFAESVDQPSPPPPLPPSQPAVKPKSRAIVLPRPEAVSPIGNSPGAGPIVEASAPDVADVPRARGNVPSSKPPVHDPPSEPPAAPPLGELPSGPASPDAAVDVASELADGGAPPLIVPPLAIEANPSARPAAETHPDATTPDPHWVPAVYLLAGGMIVAAVFGIVPAVWDVVEFVQITDSAYVARWAFLLFALAVVQIAYAVYLIQLPDWTSVWVVTLYSLALAAVYAMVLGLVLISRDDGLVVRALQFSDKLAGGKAALWCLAMVSIWSILAFFAGRLSVQWHRAEMLLRRAGL